MKSSEVAAGACREIRLLLCCARTQVDPATAERLKDLLRGDLDWKYLLQMAGHHGIVPLVYQGLHTTCPEAVPPPVLKDLRNHFHARALRNQFLTAELLRLLSLLEAHGIAVLPFKGPVLAAAVYGDLALREFGDLDLFLRRRDVLRAKDLLGAQGYRLWNPCVPRTGDPEGGCLQSWVRSPYRYHLGLERPAGQVVVELHWHFTAKGYSFPLDLEGLWERLVPVALAGRTVLHLPAEELLLVLCGHGQKHGWSRLSWICDVAELLRRHPDLAWPRVLQQADRLGGKRALGLGLYLAHDLLGTSLPPEVWQGVQADRRVPALAAQVREWLFAKAPGALCAMKWYAFHLRIRERLRDRVWYALRLAQSSLTPNRHDEALVPLPTFLYGLYYLLRPARLVMTYGNLWSLLKGPGRTGKEHGAR
jgi:hypothetical protein